MKQLPLFKFIPRLVPVVWGGQKLRKLLKKPLEPDEPTGESWEICDLDSFESRVAEGPFSGRTLAGLIREYPEEMIGPSSLLEGRFPLLCKFIDAGRRLSVQVHPDEAACSRLGLGARPKTEAWYIIDCEDNAALYVGLVEGTGRDDFEQALKEGTVEKLLHRRPVAPGDFVFLPSGTVHAIGEGIVLAEVQQSSNTTYRVFDWNRAGLDGKPRELHIDQALESIHFNEFGEPDFQKPFSGREGIRCDYFEMEKVVIDKSEDARLSGKGPVIIMCIGGEGLAEVKAGQYEQVIAPGQTLLCPACISDEIVVSSNASISMLAVTIP